MSHRNAPLTPAGRARLIERCRTRPIAHVAAEAGVSRQCLSKWKNRYDQHGAAGLDDRSSAPHASPSQSDPALVERIEHLRRTRKWSARLIAVELAAEGTPVSVATVGRWLVRLGINHRRDLDPCGASNPRHPRVPGLAGRSAPAVLDRFHSPDRLRSHVKEIPKGAWTEAYDGQGKVRQGAWIAEVTGMLDLTSWPAGMRLIIRKERPHPGAQLRITDVDGHRITSFVTNTTGGQGGYSTQLADLELRHRRRARCEDRIRIAKDTGLRNLPLHDFTQNQIWLAIVALAVELTAWMQTIALTSSPARRW
jgi:transposase